MLAGLNSKLESAENSKGMLIDTKHISNLVLMSIK